MYKSQPNCLSEAYNTKLDKDILFSFFKEILTCVRASESHKNAAAVSAILDWTLGLLELQQIIFKRMYICI